MTDKRPSREQSKYVTAGISVARQGGQTSVPARAVVGQRGTASAAVTARQSWLSSPGIALGRPSSAVVAVNARPQELRTREAVSTSEASGRSSTTDTKTTSSADQKHDHETSRDRKQVQTITESILAMRKIQRRQTFYFYVLLCEQGMIYVGRSVKPEERIIAHMDGCGAAWTKLYPPVDIIEMRKGGKYMEDMLVLEYMELFGIDKVRGGSYVLPDLPDDHRMEIEGFMRHANFGIPSEVRVLHLLRKDCVRCGRDNHTVETCEAAKHRDGYWLG